MGRFSVLFLLLAAPSHMMVAGFAGMNPQSTASPEVSRRDAFTKAAVGFLGGLTVSSLPAFAEVSEETPRVTTRMGGLLVRCWQLVGLVIKDHVCLPGAGSDLPIMFAIIPILGKIPGLEGLDDIGAFWVE